MIFVVFFQFKDVVMKRKRWLWIDNNLSASKTGLVVDGLTPGPYRLSLRLAGRHFTGRPTKKLAQCCGVATDCSSRFWRQGSIVCTFFFRGGTAQKLRMRDSRSWNWRALIWETGVRVYDGSLYCVRLSTLIHWHFFGQLFWHFCRLGWLFLALDLPHTPFEKHSKGGVILSRSSQSWENLKFDTMLTLTVGEDPQVAQHQIYRIMFSSANTRWR